MKQVESATEQVIRNTGDTLRKRDGTAFEHQGLTTSNNTITQ